MSQSRHGYVPAFDGLRGIAILPVILLHVGADSLPNGSLLYELTRGWYGVDLFFVLSGFLITWILSGEMEATGTIDLKRFYGRRFLRLGPAYVSMLAAVLVGALLLHRPEVAKIPKVLPALVTYTYNYQIALGGPHFDVLVVLWSLCVEEQFYLMWPAAFRRLGTRRALPFCLGAIALLCAYRVGLYSWLNWGHLGDPTGGSSVWIYFATDTRIGVILLGCAAALSLKNPRFRIVWRRIRESRFLPEAIAIGACLCVVFVTGGIPSSASWRSATFGYTLGAICTAALVGSVFIKQSSITARALSWSPLVGLGRISYGVYLFHAPIAWLVMRGLSSDVWARWVPGTAYAGTTADFASLGLSMTIDPVHARFAIGAAMVMLFTCVVAALHYRYVERRFLSLRAPRPAR